MMRIMVIVMVMIMFMVFIAMMIVIINSGTTACKNYSLGIFFSLIFDDDVDDVMMMGQL